MDRRLEFYLGWAVSKKNVQICVQPTYRINRDLIFSQYSIDTYPCPMRIGPAICDLPAVGEKNYLLGGNIFLLLKNETSSYFVEPSKLVSGVSGKDTMDLI